MFNRLVRLVGEEKFQCIQHAHIFLLGLGGVGGYTLEALVRSGVGFITICDFDTIEESNINRQILATLKNIGNSKVEEAKQRMQSINPNCNISVISKRWNFEDCKAYDFSHYDFVIDACDDVLLKAELINQCNQRKIPLITCMGTGNRMHPEMLEISILKKTMNDPLAKRVRQELRKVNPDALNVPVVWSKEKTISSLQIGTICPVPMVAGSLLASYVLNQILATEKMD